MSEKFCLKWNDFNSNVSKSFGTFRHEDYLHDVTLISDDQYQITAHKLVLSASSDYFKNIFKNNKISNPFLCLDGVSSIDLNNILDFIYNGQVEIYQDHLDRFLTVAQRFKLEGLLGGENNEEVQEEKVIENFDLKVKLRKPEEVKSENAYVENVSSQQDTQISLTDATDLNDLDQKLYENMERKPGGIYSCKICSKTVSGGRRRDMKYHVESHMEGLTFPCNTCGKEFRSRNSLSFHLSTKKH